MTPKTGDKYLITTDAWFYAPDGESYRAVFGTVNGIFSDKESLGIKTNRGSSNWYVSIGDMMVAGCQIHYCVKTNNVDFRPQNRDIEYQGELHVAKDHRTRIYNADGDK